MQQNLNLNNVSSGFRLYEKRAKIKRKTKLHLGSMLAIYLNSNDHFSSWYPLTYMYKQDRNH